MTLAVEVAEILFVLGLWAIFIGAFHFGLRSIFSDKPRD